MRKMILLQIIIEVLVVFGGGCSSSNDYCCISNDECVSAKGKSSSCTIDTCGKCELVDPLQINVTAWKDATVGDTYEVELTAGGGISPYTWELAIGDKKNLEWLTITWGGDNNEMATLRNKNGEYPNTPTTDDGILITITLIDGSQHGTDIRIDNQGVKVEKNLKINNCVSDCSVKDITKCVDKTLEKCYEYFPGCLKWNRVKDCDGECLSGTGTAQCVYTLVYDGNGNNGGDVPTGSVNYEQGDSVSVLGNVGLLTKTGYYFSGWNTMKDGTGMACVAGEILTVGTENITLYAMWTLIPKYTVTYDGNGSTNGIVPIDSAKYEQGTSVTVLGNTGKLLNIDGVTTAFRFNGWNTRKDGTGTTYTEGQILTMDTVNITIYAKWIAYVLRDTGPAGGLVFYDNGIYVNGWRYLEAAPIDQSTGKLWGCYGKSVGSSGTAIGTGNQNTIAITEGCTEEEIPARMCSNLDLNGYSNWFLPSKEELNLMYLNLKKNGYGGYTDDYYWSSSENGQYTAWGIVFGTGDSVSQGKGAPDRVRAARAF